ncbi:SOS response-associated peptidase [Niastella sp. OAS944]|uniref:SOS response-associated peptidase n=1 Tax=Niastella sp. OAS944 TaxID=2664089 RepID=UPI0034765E08|nr:putative SOS response-associated peptidase YedK [Chitinophagaceae bacterium OAS944]
MCYDISFSSNIQLITDYLPDLVIDSQLSIDFDLTIHVMAQAYRKYPVIIFEDDTYKLKPFEWGVIADYMNTPEKVKKGRQYMCNAQSEKIINDKKSFWRRIRTKRCLIPVTGIFEHREIKGWKNKVPYFVHLKDRPMFCIPGLYYYSPFPDVETGEIKGTFTLITRSANNVMKQIHNGGPNVFRMPMFLPKEQELHWLQPTLTDEGIQKILDFEMPSEELDYWPVFTIRSTKPRPDDLDKTAPFNWPNLPPLGTDESTEQKTLFS